MQPEMTAENLTRIDYRFNAVDYIRDVLGYTLWEGTPEAPGQLEIVQAYQLALVQQYEQRSYEAGLTALAELQHWHPGQVIQNHLRLSGGHSYGKTLVMALIVRHFFDNFMPSVTYTFAPTFPQLQDLLWKEIGVITSRADLPQGRLMADCEIKNVAAHFVQGRAVPTTDKTESIQGQHEANQLYVVDEAEGVGKAFWKSREALISGGVSIVLMSGNPATRASNFHQMAADPRCKTFILSCLSHPNVIHNRDVIPSAVRRDYVETMLKDHCEIVAQHDADKLTFEVPWRPGIIYLPDSEFQFRVMGVAPVNASDRNLIPLGRYQAACKRTPVSAWPEFAALGIDMAWDGLDHGTIYRRHDGGVRRIALMTKQEPSAYYFAAKDDARILKGLGVRRLHIRIDAGGGFASGVIELLNTDNELRQWFAELKIFKVYFGSTGRAVKEEEKWYDVVTEITADTAESLKGIAVISPPSNLEQDLCDREWEPRNLHGKFVKKLEQKNEFKKKHGRSPDDGDGFVLACASEFLFQDDDWSFS